MISGNYFMCDLCEEIYDKNGIDKVLEKEVKVKVEAKVENIKKYYPPNFIRRAICCHSCEESAKRVIARLWGRVPLK